MSPDGFLNPPPLERYSKGLSNGNTTYIGDPLLNAPLSSPIHGMAFEGSWPWSFSLGSPFQDCGLYDRQHNRVNTQRHAAVNEIIPERGNFSKIGLRNTHATNADALDQIAHFMASRNICRHFMLGICTKQKCAGLHDAAFRDKVMETLFGDAWANLRHWFQQDTSSRYSLNDEIFRNAQSNGGSTIGDKYKSEFISLENPTTLNLAAGLYVPPSLPATQANINTEMEYEKSEIQAPVGSEEAQRQDSVAESDSPLRPHGRREHRLQRVRTRMKVWRTSTWRKTATTRQRTKRGEDNVALEQGK